jgi:hypothetical protein
MLTKDPTLSPKIEIYLLKTDNNTNTTSKCLKLYAAYA